MSFALKCNAMLIQMNTGGHSKLIGKDCPSRPVEVWVKEKNTEKDGLKYRRGGGGGMAFGSLRNSFGLSRAEAFRKSWISNDLPLFSFLSAVTAANVKLDLRSLATYQGIELLWKCTKDKDISVRTSYQQHWETSTGWVLVKCGRCYFHCVVWQCQTY